VKQSKCGPVGTLLAPALGSPTINLLSYVSKAKSNNVLTNRKNIVLYILFILYALHTITIDYNVSFRNITAE